MGILQACLGWIMDFWGSFGSRGFAADAVFPGFLSTFGEAAEAAGAEAAAHSLIINYGF